MYRVMIRKYGVAQEIQSLLFLSTARSASSFRRSPHEHTMSTHSQKRVAYQFLTFLQDSRRDLRSDDAEGIDVAAQVISEAFGVDVDSDADKKSYSLGDDVGLLKVVDSYVAVSPHSLSLATESAGTPRKASRRHVNGVCRAGCYFEQYL